MAKKSWYDGVDAHVALLNSVESTMLACGGIEWVRSLNPNVRNRFLYDFLIYAGAGMWARYGVL